MRTLVVLRGAPGSGKSTWVEKWGLKPYTLCADTIRELFESPVMDDERGIMQVSQKNDRDVWRLLFDLLEQRMVPRGIVHCRRHPFTPEGLQQVQGAG